MTKLSPWLQVSATLGHRYTPLWVTCTLHSWLQVCSTLGYKYTPLLVTSMFYS